MNRQRLPALVFAVFIMTLTQASPALADLKTGLVAHYTLNGNGNDASGNANNGAVVGAVPAPDRFGQANSAYRFTNNPAHGATATSYIEIPDSATLRPMTGITVSAWINTSNSEGRAIVGKQFGSGLEDSYLMWYNVGTLWFTLYPFGSASVSAPVPTLGAWHLVTGTWDGSTVRLYVDGNEVASSAFAGPMEYDGNPVVIGADNDNADDVPDDGWDGLIDDVRIYNRALSPGEIGELLSGCTLDVTPTYTGTTLNLGLELGTPAAATWNVWIVVQNTSVRLWSVPIPAIEPPASFTIPLTGVPHLGVLGVLTTTSGPAGITCSDWETVDTGQ